LIFYRIYLFTPLHRAFRLGYCLIVSFFFFKVVSFTFWVNRGGSFVFYSNGRAVKLIFTVIFGFA